MITTNEYEISTEPAPERLKLGCAPSKSSGGGPCHKYIKMELPRATHEPRDKHQSRVRTSRSSYTQCFSLVAKTCRNSPLRVSSWTSAPKQELSGRTYDDSIHCHTERTIGHATPKRNSLADAPTTVYPHQQSYPQQYLVTSDGRISPSAVLH